MANKLEYRELIPSDFEEVMSLELRDVEVKELRASIGLPPMEALALSVADSRYAWVITHNDKICGIFGLALRGNERVTGIPWMLSNELPFLLPEHRALFLKTSKEVVRLMQSKCDLLFNTVSVENKQSIRWLRWLGFTIHEDTIETYPHDPSVAFVRFTMGGTRSV